MPGMYRRTTTALFSAALLGSVCAAAIAWGDPPPLRIEDVIREVGFGEAERATILAGEIVSSRLPESGELELAVVAATRTSSDVQTIFEQLQNGPLFEMRRSILARGAIPLDGSREAVRESFEGLTLPPAEIDALGRADPGTQLNLSFAEIAALRAAAESAPPGERQESVAHAYRELLARRVRAYLKEGLAGIAPYARDAGAKTSAAELLRARWTESRLFDASLPKLKQVLLGAPVPDDMDATQQLYWFVEDLDDRHTVVLSHRLLAVREGVMFLYERQFYIGQSYDALQILAGAFDTPDGTVMVYSNRAYMDRAAGFGSSATHAVRAGMLRDRAEKLLDTFRSREVGATSRSEAKALRRGEM